jgi:long-subunit acyl-CoA synthetase (AMP-forming)
VHLIGQTECGAACAVTLIGDSESGHVGPPLPCNTIKLADVADMEVAKINCLSFNKLSFIYSTTPKMVKVKYAFVVPM